MNQYPWIGPVAGYLAGSIPFGIIFSLWLSGIDPRKSGSGNIGFTNVLRVAGKTAGVLTLLGDMGKGYLAVRIAQRLSLEDPSIWLTGMAAILGHNYTVFLGFKGGKGVATGLGVLYGLDPILGWTTILIWSGTVFWWRISSLGAIMAFGFLPVLVLLVYPVPWAIGLSVLISGIILLKHRPNFQRLWSGTEPRIGESR